MTGSDGQVKTGEEQVEKLNGLTHETNDKDVAAYVHQMSEDNNQVNGVTHETNNEDVGASLTLMSEDNTQNDVSEESEEVDVMPCSTDDDHLDKGYAWVIVFAVFAIHVVYDGINYSCGIFLQGAIYGSLVHKFGCRKVGTWASITAALSLFASAFAPNIYVLFVTFTICSGISFGLLYVSAMLVLSEYFKHRLALATGLAICGTGIGTVSFAPLTRWLLDNYGWRGTLAIHAAISLHCLACCALFRPVKRKKIIKQRHNILSKENLMMYVHVLKNPMFPLLLIGSILSSMAYFTCYIFLPDLVQQAGHSAQKGALAISAIGISQTISRGGLSWIGDVSCFDTLLVFVVIGIITGISVLMMPLFQPYVLIISAVVVYGLACGISATLGFVLLVQLFSRDYLAHCMGLQMSLSQPFGLLGPLLTGILYDKSQSYTAPFVTYGVCSILGSLVRLSVCFTPQYKTAIKDSNHQEEKDEKKATSTKMGSGPDDIEYC